jgi:DNA-directed RNA polymerase specialized sigma24 family protein
MARQIENSSARIVEIETLLSALDMFQQPEKSTSQSFAKLAHLIFEHEYRIVQRISSLGTSELIDGESIALTATQEFLERYVIHRSGTFLNPVQIQCVLNSIAKCRALNAMRDLRRKRRHPEDHILGSDYVDEARDTRHGGRPFDRLELEELAAVLESQLGDANLKPVFRMLIQGYSIQEISSVLQWDAKTVLRFVASIRRELVSWCNENMPIKPIKLDAANKGQRTKDKEQRTKDD